ncbi:uncharacterized protein ACHE_60572S [Aspergillus chevalieri]|uniref:Uncharacterized protein n=1 Tax=Aspergillus chevalieri TaxID=182096 RepID=A0A7R7VTU0_ASPCH|nr:uncharacterized protein ACHE_60572S [Aspergillus chevalieri]BCR90686.1 hypothetical protein ACHE_60572S [Aspergillus chevalieri]
MSSNAKTRHRSPGHLPKVQIKQKRIRIHTTPGKFEGAQWLEGATDREKGSGSGQVTS